eukprot:SAG11_NODE_539_length_8658_cov_8.164973_4_plen_100_part_00
MWESVGNVPTQPFGWRDGEIVPIDPLNEPTHECYSPACKAVPKPGECAEGEAKDEVTGKCKAAGPAPAPPKDYHFCHHHFRPIFDRSRCASPMPMMLVQ